MVAAENAEVTGFYEQRSWRVMDVLSMGKELKV